MALTTLPLRLREPAGSTTRDSLFLRSIGLGLMLLCLPMLTGCGPGGNAGDGLIVANPGNGKAYGPGPKIRLSETSLAFSAIQGGSDPAAQIVSISTTGAGALDWSVNTAATWLVLSPISGTTPASFTATANITGLAAGTYSTTITVTSVGAVNTPQSIPVTVTVSAPTPTSPTSSISLSPTSLTFSAIQGGSDPAAQTVSISDSGAGTLDWSVSTGAPWLALSSISGTTPASFTATANITGLAAGTYSTTITVTAVGAINTPQFIPVTVTVSASTSLTTISTTTTVAASLSWYPSTDQSVTGYFVHYGTQSPNLNGSCAYAQSTFYPLSSLSSLSSPSVTVTDIAPGTTYFFAVSAYNGVESACSNEVLKAT